MSNVSNKEFLRNFLWIFRLYLVFVDRDSRGKYTRESETFGNCNKCVATYLANNPWIFHLGESLNKLPEPCVKTVRKRNGNKVTRPRWQQIITTPRFTKTRAKRSCGCTLCVLRAFAILKKKKEKKEKEKKKQLEASRPTNWRLILNYHVTVQQSRKNISNPL